MKKFIIALATAIIICVPAFADNDSFASGSIETFVNGNSSNVYTSTDTNKPVYFWLEYSSDESQVYTNAISLDSSSPFSITLSSSGSTFNYTTDTLFTTIDGQGIYVSRNSVGGSVSQYTHSPELSPFPFNSSSIVGADFLSYLENGGSTSVASSFTVPSGNVLYFQVTSEQDIDFDANMPRLSSPIFASQFGPWGNTGIKFGPAASLPTSGTTFPILSQDNIRWFVQAPTNVFGQSKIGTMQKHCIVGQWYALYCPDVFGLNGTSADLDSNSTVPGASVKVSGSFAQIKVYPLTSTFDFTEGEFVTSSNDDYTSYFDGTIDENGTVTFTDQNGDVNSPVSGGQNFQDYETDPFALVENIKTILSNILSEIKSLFTFGYDAIQSLVNIMSDFVNVFQQLYTWLPSEVYTALVSAIIVAITIGVFKVFL